MRVRWRDFELPNQVVLNKETQTDKYGKFVIEPFERGFGVTVGNSLRRVLLSSLEGAAIYSLKIDGVTHEFTGIKGVYEDVTDIVLRLKKVHVSIYEGNEAELLIERNKKGVITAGDIQCPSNVEILNPDLTLLTLTENVKFSARFLARKGRGYVTATELSKGEDLLGTIFIDACFSPVVRVKYKIEETRVGQKTNYDRLILEIWTDGTITPEFALVEAAKVLRKHLNSFVQYNTLGDERLPKSELLENQSQKVLEEQQSKEDEINSKNVSALNLTVRARNCLEAVDITTIGKLVVMSEQDLLKIDNLGKTTVNEIKRRLEEWGLNLGMIPYKDSGKVEV